MTSTGSITIRAAGRIVAGGYYDLQEVRLATMNRIRILLRRIDLDLPVDKPEPKKAGDEGENFDKKYQDENLPVLINELFKGSKLTEQERDYLRKTLELAQNSSALERSHIAPMQAMAEGEAIWTGFMQHIRGIGPVIAANLLARFGYCERHGSVSALWRNCGLHVVCPKCTETVHDEERDLDRVLALCANDEGRCPKCGTKGISPRRRKGLNIDYNPGMRTMAWKIATSLMKTGSPLYRGIYDEDKARQSAREYAEGELLAAYGKPYKKGDTRLSKGHSHSRALRKVAKIFLQHYWAATREMAGLAVNEPYAATMPHHTRIITWREALEANKAASKKGAA